MQILLIILLLVIGILMLTGLFFFYDRIKNAFTLFKNWVIRNWKKILGVTIGGMIIGGGVLLPRDELPGADVWTNPDTTNDPNAKWSNDDNAKDGRMNTFADLPQANQGYYLELLLTNQLYCDKVKIFGGEIDKGSYSGNQADVTIAVYYNSAWHQIWNNQTLTKETATTIQISGGAFFYVTKARITAYTITAGKGFGLSYLQFNDTSTVPPGNFEWKTPDEVYDANSDWTGESNSIDDNTDTYSYTTTNYSYLQFNLSTNYNCSKVRVKAKNLTGGQEYDPLITVDVYYGGAWQEIKNGTITKDIWVTLDISAGNVSTNKSRFCITNITGGAMDMSRLYEFDFGVYVEPPNEAPNITSESPSNQSTNIDITQSTVNVTIQDLEGDTFDWTIEVNNSDNNSANGASNGSKSCSLTTPLAYDTTYTWYVNATDGNTSANKTYTFTTRDTYTPVLVTFIASSYNRNSNYLTMGVTTYADCYYIRGEKNSYPTNMTDGTLISNSTDATGVYHSGLTEGDHWYYKAWCYNSTDGIWGSNGTGDATVTNGLPSFISISPTGSQNPYVVDDISVRVKDNDSDLMNWTIEVSNGNNNSGNNAESYDYIPCNLSSIDGDTTYTYYVNVTDGYGWTNNSYAFNTTNPGWAYNNISVSETYDANGNWTNDSYACDEVGDFIKTYAYTDDVDAYLQFNFSSSINCSKIRIYMCGLTAGLQEAGEKSASFDIDFYYSGAWHTIWTYSTEGNVEKFLSIFDGNEYIDITKARISCTELIDDAVYGACYDITFYNYTYTNVEPTVISTTPVNSTLARTGVTTSQIVVDISDYELINWSVDVSTGDSANATSELAGIKTCSLTIPMSVDTLYTWWLNMTDGTFTVNNTYYFKTFKTGKDMVIITNIFETQAETYRSFRENNSDMDIDLINTSTIIADSDYYVNGTWGDGNSSNPWYMNQTISNYSIYNDTSCKIRNYIRYITSTYDTQYVLLYGSQWNVSCKYFYSMTFGGTTSRNMECHWFGCLNGTQNKADNQTYYGGAEASSASSLTDDFMDVIPGRIPVRNTTHASNYLQKANEYVVNKTEGDTWARTISIFNNMIIDGTEEEGLWSGTNGLNTSRIGTIYKDYYTFVYDNNSLNNHVMSEVQKNNEIIGIVNGENATYPEGISLYVYLGHDHRYLPEGFGYNDFHNSTNPYFGFTRSCAQFCLSNNDTRSAFNNIISEGGAVCDWGYSIPMKKPSNSEITDNVDYLYSQRCSLGDMVKEQYNNMIYSDNYATVIFGDPSIEYIYEDLDSTVTNPIPTNNSIQSVLLDELSINITNDYLTFDWTIETSPNIGSNSSNSDSSGIKNCSISNLVGGINYTWYVNATGGTNWNNKTYYFTTYINTTVRTNGVDYFVWVGANQSAYHVKDTIGATFNEAGETISVLNNTGHWDNYTGTGSGNNFSIYTFDVVKIVLDDGAGTLTFNMTPNLDIDYLSARTVTLTKVGNGYNYTGWSSSASTTLSAENTTLSLATGYWIALWNETNYVWDYWISGFGFTNKNIHQYDVIMTKIAATKNNWQVG